MNDNIPTGIGKVLECVRGLSLPKAVCREMLARRAGSVETRLKGAALLSGPNVKSAQEKC